MNEHETIEAVTAKLRGAKFYVGQRVITKGDKLPGQIRQLKPFMIETDEGMLIYCGEASIEPLCASECDIAGLSKAF